MKETKQYLSVLKDLINIIIIGSIVFLPIFVLYKTFSYEQELHRKTYEHNPHGYCFLYYSNTPIRNVPAKCLSYFLEEE